MPHQLFQDQPAMTISDYLPHIFMKPVKDVQFVWMYLGYPLCLYKIDAPHKHRFSILSEGRA